MDRTSFLTRSYKAVQKRNLFLHLSGREGFHCLYVVRVCLCLFHEPAHRISIYSCKYCSLFLKKGRHLGHSVISAGLQKRSRHCHRPDSCFYDIFNIVEVCTAGIGDTQFPVKVFRQLRRHRDGQRIQGLARHIHLFAGQFILFHIYRKCICDLYSELKISLLADFHQPCKHGNCVLILQVVFEVEISERHIVVSHFIHHLSRILIAEKCRIAFDKCMEPFFRDQVHGDPLDLLRRTSVQCRDRNRIADIS